MPKTTFILIVLLAVQFSSKAQFTGAFETYASRYSDDSKIKLDATEADDRLRANSYLRLDYRFNNFTTGLQVESYRIRRAKLQNDVVVGFLDLTELGNRIINAAGNLRETFAFAFRFGR